MALQRLKDAAEKAKKDLSGVTSTQISLPFITAGAAGPLHLEMTLTRAKFDDLTRDLVAVSYTHLDVYKRQLLAFHSKPVYTWQYVSGTLMHGSKGCLLYTSLSYQQ